MVFDTVSADQMRAARLFVGATLAIWIGVGFIPGLQKYARSIRGTLLALYLLTFLAFVVSTMLASPG